ncbi:MAG: hypothetical protein AAFU54_27150 [Chloroflexota bacterium]
MTERKQPLRTLPDEMRLKRDGKSIRIYWRWRTANTELLWWAFLIVIITTLTLTWQIWDEQEFRSLSTATRLGLSLLFFAGVYVLVLMWRGEVSLRINPEQVSFAFQLYPFDYPVRLHSQNSRAIRQVFIKEVPPGQLERLKGYPHYEIGTLTDKGKKRRIAGGIDRYEQAAFIKQEIETYLDIEHHR